jgi:hypothetical protein
MKNCFFFGGKIAVCAIVLFTTMGCAHTAKYRAKAQGELEEHSRALTTAVVDTLHAQPTDARDSYTELALTLARQDERVEGFPLEPIPTNELLAVGSTNDSVEVVTELQRAAAEDLEQRFERINTLLARERSAEQRLIALGTQAETERNARRTRWWKWGGSTALVLGGLAAVCVFFPAAIPIVGRLLAWIVGRVPALAGAAGVVSVNAFDAVVKAVERSKSGANANANFGNEVRAYRHLRIRGSINCTWPSRAKWMPLTRNWSASGKRRCG